MKDKQELEAPEQDKMKQKLVHKEGNILKWKMLEISKI